MPRSPFPPWANQFRVLAALLVLLGPLYLVALVAYGLSPATAEVGYTPTQPVPNNHALHVGRLGVDCRFCHHAVERSGVAGLPDVATCQVCHKSIRARSPLLEPLRVADSRGMSIPWVRVGELPDFVFFEHRGHVTRGVPCVACHGAVEVMAETWQAQAFTMSFCLDCHRWPDPALRPLDQITSTGYRAPSEQPELGRELRLRYAIQPSTDCSTCHR